ncbi:MULTISPECIES: ABC transporter permease [Nocardia]|uniref:ABC transporter permease n=1 Tax=Nocardia TaxID=1817 RepID=UPI001893B1FE|nr:MULTISPECIES: ABC transporter permease [Nocardia]MBF6347513.1 ABC transporter permease [Nocardia flavorosea]
MSTTTVKPAASDRIEPETAAGRPDAAAPPARRSRRRNIGALAGAIWLIAITLAAVAAPMLPLPDPAKITDQYSIPPFREAAHILGTDPLGRDLLSRVVHGAQISLSVAIGATLLALAVGTAFGLAAGFFRRKVDVSFDIGTNTILAFPPLILLIALVAVMEPSIGTLVVGLALVGMPTFARIARANTIAFASREFVTASKSLGASTFRILVREILPNVALPVFSFAIVVAASLVVAEGSLSFLGLGVPPPAPSWGGMIAAGRESLYETPYLVLVPGAFFFLTVLSLNLTGDWARDRIGRESSL